MRVRLTAGRASATYSDSLLPLLAALAPASDWRVERATDVEFEGGEWIARLARPLRGLPTGAVLARSPDRETCLAAERAWLECAPCETRAVVPYADARRARRAARLSLMGWSHV